MSITSTNQISQHILDSLIEYVKEQGSEAKIAFTRPGGVHIYWQIRHSHKFIIIECRDYSEALIQLKTLASLLVSLGAFPQNISYQGISMFSYEFNEYLCKEKATDFLEDCVEMIRHPYAYLKLEEKVDRFGPYWFDAIRDFLLEMSKKYARPFEFDKLKSALEIQDPHYLLEDIRERLYDLRRSFISANSIKMYAASQMFKGNAAMSKWVREKHPDVASMYDKFIELKRTIRYIEKDVN